ncbi:MAG: hypothetical protein QOI03_2274 [Solirubrobacteraceae bacterium]|nr:hypothetical protein [Solirubrobacteraceae bacterium]
MELEDRIVIKAPEGIDLQIVLAGAASRFIAGAVDLFLQVVLIGLAALVTLALVGGGVGLALFAMTTFAGLYLYDILFEVFAAGRTPGKRWTHLRVVRAEGQPIDLPASAIRNLLRLIDILPGAYLVGILCIVLTKRNQRLGDLAAGTIVIREPTGGRRSVPRATDEQPLRTAGWDVSAVSAEELATVRRFLERRDDLSASARRELGFRLEQGLRRKVAGAPDALSPEAFLAALVQAKSSRS